MASLNGPSVKPASGGAPRQLIVFLHGYGSDGNDLISLAPYFAAALPDAEFLSPNAPEKGEMGFGYQWCTLQNRTIETVFQGMVRAAPVLNAFLDEKLAERNLADKDLALVGFSQGAMISLHTAPRRKNPCAGIVAFSGALIKPEALAAELQSRPPVLLVHGALDDVVPYESLPASERALKNLDFDVETLTCPHLAHSIDEAGLQRAVSFLSKQFQS